MASLKPRKTLSCPNVSLPFQFDHIFLLFLSRDTRFYQGKTFVPSYYKMYINFTFLKSNTLTHYKVRGRANFTLNKWPLTTKIYRKFVGIKIIITCDNPSNQDIQYLDAPIDTYTQDANK